MQKDVALQLAKSRAAALQVLVSERLGENNPFGDIDVDKLDLSDLAQVSRAMHEVAYAPPPRQ